MSYADDIANLNNNREEAEELLNILWHESQKAVMSVNMAKTKVLRIVRKMQVSNTKEAEVEAALKHPHVCDRCGKPYPNKHSLAVHQGRWCSGDRETELQRSRKGQIADKIVQASKREFLIFYTVR